MQQPLTSSEARGLFRSLFDFSFTSLITTKIIRFVYILVVALQTLAALVFFFVGIVSGKPSGILFSLIVIPVLYLIYLILFRISMEILIVIFKMSEDLHAIRLGQSGPPPGYGPGIPGPGYPPSVPPYSPQG